MNSSFSLCNLQETHFIKIELFVYKWASASVVLVGWNTRLRVLAVALNRTKIRFNGSHNWEGERHQHRRQLPEEEQDSGFDFPTPRSSFSSMSISPRSLFSFFTILFYCCRKLKYGCVGKFRMWALKPFLCVRFVQRHMQQYNEVEICALGMGIHPQFILLLVVHFICLCKMVQKRLLFLTLCFVP